MFTCFCDGATSNDFWLSRKKAANHCLSATSAFTKIFPLQTLFDSSICSCWNARTNILCAICNESLIFSSFAFNLVPCSSLRSWDPCNFTIIWTNVLKCFPCKADIQSQQHEQEDIKAESKCLNALPSFSAFYILFFNSKSRHQMAVFLEYLYKSENEEERLRSGGRRVRVSTLLKLNNKIGSKN